MQNEIISTLTKERYINLQTFRKNGTGVWTPVWFAIGGKGRTLLVMTNGRSYKVKRLRRDTRCEVAACNVTGKIHGPTYQGHCTILSEKSTADEALKKLYDKYGWQMRMLSVAARFGRRRKDWTLLEIALDDS